MDDNNEHKVLTGMSEKYIKKIENNQTRMTEAPEITIQANTKMNMKKKCIPLHSRLISFLGVPGTL